MREEKIVCYIVEFRENDREEWEMCSEHTTWSAASAEVRDFRVYNLNKEGSRSFRLVEVTEIRKTVSASLGVIG